MLNSKEKKIFYTLAPSTRQASLVASGPAAVRAAAPKFLLDTKK